MIVTGYGFEESPAYPGLGEMEVPGLFFQRPAPSSGRGAAGAAVLTIRPVRGAEGGKDRKARVIERG